MEILTLPTEATEWSAQARRGGSSIGFVPTMGALHEGHLDLVRKAKDTCDVVVCSIFVNPLQFNDPRDLERYPRQLDQDSVLLERTGCDLLLAPDRKDMLRGFTPRAYDLEGLDAHWEGPCRPGHFQGVVNIVERLFFHVRPDLAFFGEKDRQQLAILRAVARQQRWPERIVPCTTVRDADGLALSSRNQRLNADERRSATVLYRALKVLATHAFRSTPDAARQAALNVLEAEPSVGLDYLGIADAETLVPVEQWDPLRAAVGLIAAHVGPVRLIDNITLTPPAPLSM